MCRSRHEGSGSESADSCGVGRLQAAQGADGIESPAVAVKAVTCYLKCSYRFRLEDRFVSKTDSSRRYRRWTMRSHSMGLPFVLLAIVASSTGQTVAAATPDSIPTSSIHGPPDPCPSGSGSCCGTCMDQGVWCSWVNCDPPCTDPECCEIISCTKVTCQSSIDVCDYTSSSCAACPGHGDTFGCRPPLPWCVALKGTGTPSESDASAAELGEGEPAEREPSTADSGQRRGAR